LICSIIGKDAGTTFTFYILDDKFYFLFSFLFGEEFSFPTYHYTLLFFKKQCKKVIHTLAKYIFQHFEKNSALYSECTFCNVASPIIINQQ